MVHVVVAGLIAALVAGCAANGGSPGPEPNVAQTQGRSAVAFEPVTGIPEGRSAVLAEELVTGAVDRGLLVVPRDSDDVTYRIKGHFSAARAGSATRLTYVWDIFDAEERRVHRLKGTETVEVGLPDPWQAVTDEALRRAARQSVEGLTDWLEQGAPATARASGEPETTTLASASGHGGSLALAALETDSGATAALASTGRAAAGRSVFVGPVSGAAGDGTSLLPRALAERLAAAGLERTNHPADADFLVTGEATVAPPENGSQTVAVIWSVTRRGGGSLGTVRQVSRVAAHQLDESWGASAGHAAEAAAPGVLALMDTDDDSGV